MNNSNLISKKVFYNLSTACIYIYIYIYIYIKQVRKLTIKEIEM